MSKPNSLWRIMSWLTVHGLTLLIKIAQQIKKIVVTQTGQASLNVPAADSRVQQLGQLIESFVLVEIFSQKTSLNRWLDLRRMIEAQQLPLDTAQQHLSQLQGSVDIGERFAGFLVAYMQMHGGLQPSIEVLLQRLDQAIYQYGLNAVATPQVPLYATHYRKNKQCYYAVYSGWVYEWDTAAQYYFPVSDLEFSSVMAFLIAPTVLAMRTENA